MKPLIAVSGKGGTGKSTLSALLVRQFVRSGVRPVLAVDADPNHCLGELLGLEVPGTLAELRDEVRRNEGQGTGASKINQIDQGLNEIIAEGTGFDLLTMGRPEGAGCYCYINALLRDWLKRASRNYAVCLVDNEAGMEHISRLVTAAVDSLVVVAEPTIPAARAVRRILELSRNLPMQVGRRVVVWNKVRPEGVAPKLREAAGEDGADASFVLPHNERLEAAYTNAEPLTLDGIELDELAGLAQLCLLPRVSSTATVR
jgi:CO dehydrogenase maturation factor